MSIHDDFVQRLSDGFSEYGYTLSNRNDRERQYQFRCPSSDLAFLVINGEGGFALIWSKADGAKGMKNSFRSREGFWKAVSDLVAEHI